MTQTVTIRLPEYLSNQVDQIINERNISRSELLHEAISEYLYSRQLKKLRDQMLHHKSPHNIQTDEDVFRIIS